MSCLWAKRRLIEHTPIMPKADTMSLVIILWVGGKAERPHFKLPCHQVQPFRNNNPDRRRLSSQASRDGQLLR